MKAIIAVNKLGYIGKERSLPWEKCPEDLKHFKKLTNGKHIIVGYNTKKNLPLLPNRTVWNDDEKLLNFLKENPKTHEDLWCIGGKKTYEKYCHLFTELHISYIDDHTIGDVMFPDFKNLNPDCEFFHYNF